MERLREMINPEEMGVREGPTTHKTMRNLHKLHCQQCGDLYYVDEKTIRRVYSALEGDASDNLFRCPRCEEEYEEEAYEH